MMRRTHCTAVLLWAGLVSACSTQLEVQVVRQYEDLSLPPREEQCELRLYHELERPPEGCVEVGDVFVGDNGFSTICDRSRVEAEVRRQGCLFGATAAQVVHHYFPHPIETECHQIRARLLSCDAIVVERLSR